MSRLCHEIAWCNECEQPVAVYLSPQRQMRQGDFIVAPACCYLHGPLDEKAIFRSGDREYYPPPFNSPAN